MTCFMVLLLQVGKKLGKTNSLIGAALRLLTDEVGSEATLKTSLGTLVCVLDAVNWHAGTSTDGLASLPARRTYHGCQGFGNPFTATKC